MIMQTCLNNMHISEKYAREVVAKLRGPVCDPEMKACQRQLNDLDRQDTDGFPYVFDVSRADRIIDWFEKCCRHPRGAFKFKLFVSSFLC